MRSTASSDDSSILLIYGDSDAKDNAFNKRLIRSEMEMGIDFRKSSKVAGVILFILVSSTFVSNKYPPIPSNRRSLSDSNIFRDDKSSAPELVPSVEELKSYVHFAYAAFCPDETLQNWTCPWCSASEFQVASILFNETTQTRGFVGYDQSRNITIASFRGSFGSAANWWLNLRLGSTTEFYNVKIRTGWHKAYEALREQLLEALQQVHDNCPSCSNTFITTGHSLGAVIGSLAALDAKLTIPWIQKVQIRNFGMPRVGHKDFVDLFHDNVESSFRVVHYRDLVPHYPLRMGFLSPYHHVGSELWVPQKEFDGTFKHCDGSGEDPLCSASLPVWDWDPDDHNVYLGVKNDNCGQNS